jgi:hypothetical protein
MSSALGSFCHLIYFRYILILSLYLFKVSHRSSMSRYFTLSLRNKTYVNCEVTDFVLQLQLIQRNCCVAALNKYLTTVPQSFHKNKKHGHYDLTVKCKIKRTDCCSAIFIQFMLLEKSHGATMATVKATPKRRKDVLHTRPTIAWRLEVLLSASSFQIANQDMTRAQIPYAGKKLCSPFHNSNM